MIKKTDINTAIKRKKMWDKFGWTYGDGFIGYLRNNHSLKCNCSMCRAEVFYKHYENKQKRLKYNGMIRKEN